MSKINWNYLDLKLGQNASSKGSNKFGWLREEIKQNFCLVLVWGAEKKKIKKTLFLRIGNSASWVREGQDKMSFSIDA